MPDAREPRSGAPHVVIIGGGFAGLYAARELKKAHVRLTVIDRRNHHLFQPLLYQVATAGLSPEQIAHPIRVILSRQNNARVLLEEVTSIDLSRRAVVMTGGETAYDYLIVASGAEDAYYGHPDWKCWAPGLKDLEEALEVRRRILLAFERAEREPDLVKRQGLLTFVIVGAGPTGVELAGAIAEISRHVMVQDFRAIDPRESHVILIEGGPQILPEYPATLSEKAEKSLSRLGVQVLTNSRVTAVEQGSVAIGGNHIEAQTIVWAAGVKASSLGEFLGAPLDKSGRVLVEPDLSLPGHREVFIAGDLAAFFGPSNRRVPGVAPAAIQEGRHAAKNIMRAIQGKPTAVFHYRDKGSLATIGRDAAVAWFGPIKLSGFIAWVTWMMVHIFFLIGFRNRVSVMIDWAWAYFTDRREARLVIGNIEK